MLQADAYAGFNAVYDSGDVHEAACWAHARRKFHDLHMARPSPLTAEALRRIAELYVIETNIRAKPPDERRSVRQARFRPLLDDLERWLRTAFEKLSRKSDTAAAIQYALKLWPALARYCDDGDIEIDNSAAERALRGIAIGRRNYLFAGADSGGERAWLTSRLRRSLLAFCRQTLGPRVMSIGIAVMGSLAILCWVTFRSRYWYY